MRYMLYMFSLFISLDLPSLNTSHVKYIEYVIDDSETFEYINLINFDEKKLYNDGFVIRINNIITKYKLYPQIKDNLKCHNIYCTDNLKSKKNILYNINLCIERYDKSSQYIYEYNRKYYENLKNRLLYDENNQINKYKCEIIVNLIIGISFVIVKEKFIKKKEKDINVINDSQSKIIYPGVKIGFLEIKKNSHKIFNLSGQNELKADDNKLEEIKEKRKKYNILKNYILNNNFIIIVIILIKSRIVINLFIKTRSNILNYCFFRYSKITLKVKGISKNRIMYNHYNYLDKIYINSNKINSISSLQYFFNQSENFVEIILKDNIIINDLSQMFFGMH